MAPFKHAKTLISALLHSSLQSRDRPLTFAPAFYKVNTQE
jgi:hypothetical protein